MGTVANAKSADAYGSPEIYCEFNSTWRCPVSRVHGTCTDLCPGIIRMVIQMFVSLEVYKKPDFSLTLSLSRCAIEGTRRVAARPLFGFFVRFLNPRRYSELMLLWLCSVGAVAAQAPTQTGPLRHLNLPGEAFVVDGRPAFVLLPAEALRQTPQPWIFYAPTLPAYPDIHERWMHEQFLAAGVAVAGIDAGEAYGSPQGQTLMSALYREMTERRGFALKPCLLGRSRGGLWVSSWAIAHPEQVAGIAGIYPVLDLRTYPGLAKAAPAYGMTPQELEAGLLIHNPIARIDVLAEAKVPVCIIHGDEDQVVPLKENSATLAERYRHRGAGEMIQLIVAEGQGHNYWEGFFRCQPLVDFAIQRAKAGS